MECHLCSPLTCFPTSVVTAVHSLCVCRLQRAPSLGPSCRPGPWALILFWGHGRQAQAGSPGPLAGVCQGSSMLCWPGSEGATGAPVVSGLGAQGAWLHGCVRTLECLLQALCLLFHHVCHVESSGFLVLKCRHLNPDPPGQHGAQRGQQATGPGPPLPVG